MISQLSIQNFQSHRDSHLTFDPGVNIIIGPSDSGKTAIIRALRWLIWNRPQGDSMRSNWGGETEVSISFSEPDLEVEPEVTRRKGKMDEYIMNGMSFKALRGEVPKEVQQVINISEVNLQRQLDSPFLLSNTAGEVALHFNKVAKLDQIDTATQRINSWIRELTNVIKFKEEQISTLSGELKAFDHLEKFEIELEVLEQLNSQWLAKVLNKNSFDKLIRNIQHINVLIDNNTPLLEFEAEVDNLLSLYTKKEKATVDRKKLWSLLSSVNLTQDDIDYNNSLTQFEAPVNDLLSFYEEIYRKDKEYGKLDAFVVEVKGVEKKLNLQVEKVKALEERWETEFPEKCPLCNKPK